MMCPKCGSDEKYTFKRHSVMRCKACGTDYSATSITEFRSSKLPIAKRERLIAAIIENPTLSSQKIADMCGVTQKTAWLWKVRVLSPNGAASVKGYFQGARKASGIVKSSWKIKHVDPWPEEKHSEFVALWLSGVTTARIADHFGIEPGTVSQRVIRHGLPSRRRTKYTPL